MEGSRGSLRRYLKATGSRRWRKPFRRFPQTRDAVPTVSRKVSDLEAHLGTQLVVRTSRELLLTDAGVAFVAAGRRVLEDLDEAERAAAGEYSARVATFSYGAHPPRGSSLVCSQPAPASHVQ